MATRRQRALLSALAVIAATGLLVSAVLSAEDAPTPGATTEGKPGLTLKDLTPAEEAVIVYKGTERPFSGKYYNFHEAGTYLCRRCGAPLYESEDKFDSGCGWPSFDDEIPGAVKRVPDADGRRTEIICANCGAHLGHVFEGERLTDKNVRHCVNSISLDFIPAGQKADAASAVEDPAAAGAEVSAAADPAEVTDVDADGNARAYFAGGCFWGVEYMLEHIDGVVDVRSGYMGGHTENPTYQDVCRGNTGHAETVEVVFDPKRVTFEELARNFFEIHDPTQLNRQGPDHGAQYRSAVFYTDEAQKATTEKLIGLLRDNGYDVVTEVSPAGTFWPAEDYHQDYYDKTGHRPYCHAPQKRF
jgi:peptide methionine sulfoxide reductase msrA/msrB